VTELVGKHLIIEEKIDGSNSGISFDDEGILHLQSRGHYLHGGPREKQFELFKQWASTHQVSFRSILGTRYVLMGEWMFAKHTVFYDALPHYFMEFDVLDVETAAFLDTPSRRKLLGSLAIEPVPVVYEGKIRCLRDIERLITHSNFISDDRNDNLIKAALESRQDPVAVVEHTDMSEDMEGLYIKWEEDGVVKGRYKFVRSTFTNSIIDQEQHWHDRPIVQNGLIAGALEGMFV